MVAKGETVDLTFGLGDEEAVQWASPGLASIQGVYLYLGCDSTVVEGMEMSRCQPTLEQEQMDLATG